MSAFILSALKEFKISSPGFQTPTIENPNIPGLQLALALGLSIYFFREHKRLGLGRAGGLTASALIAGTTIGGLLEQALHVDIAPLLGIRNPATIVRTKTEHHII